MHEPFPLAARLVSFAPFCLDAVVVDIVCFVVTTTAAAAADAFAVIQLREFFFHSTFAPL